MTIFSKSHPLNKPLRVVASIAVAALLIGFFLAHRARGEAERQLAEWKVRADSAVVYAQAQQDSARYSMAQADSFRIKWQDAKAEGKRLDRKIDSLIANVPKVPTVVPDTCLPWANRVKGLEVVVSAQSVRIDSLKSEAQLKEFEADTLRSAATRLNRSVDSLTTVITEMPTIPKRSPITFGPGVAMAYVNKRFEFVPVVSVHIPLSLKSIAKKLLPF